jgi:hypothetical protein
MPRDNPKVRMTLWLTGMAAEKKGVGRSDPLRRTRNRQRVRALVDSVMEEMGGASVRRNISAHSMLSQAQDRANFICGQLFEAIEVIAARLKGGEMVNGEEVAKAVAAAKLGRVDPEESHFSPLNGSLNPLERRESATERDAGGIPFKGPAGVDSLPDAKKASAKET